MKKLSARLSWAALLVVSVAVSASVSPPAPLPSHVDLMEARSPLTGHGQHKLLVDVADTGKRLVAVGESGLVMLSPDGGNAWSQAPTPTSVMLTAVHFPSPQSGWAVGHDGVILATRDGGLTWARQFDGRQGDQQMLEAARAQLARLPASRAGTPDAPSDLRMALEDAVAGTQAAVEAGPSRPLLAVRFADEQTGFAAGSFGQLFTTDDGGRHWHYIGDRLDNTEGLHLNALTLSEDGHLYIAAEAGTVFVSPDMGRTWTRSHSGYKGHLYGVLSLPGDVLLAYGFNGHLLRSTDGGQAWKPVASPTTKSIVSATAVDGQALLVDEEGQLLSSSDQGENWARMGQRLPVRRVGAMALVRSTWSNPHGAPAFDVLTVGLGGAERHALRWPAQTDKNPTP